jgi:tRNA(adenine34) deaminase
MWKDLSEIWRETFKLAWESYRKNTIPIGAVIVNAKGEIVSKGRNRIFDTESLNPLAGTCMAHAEMTAMVSLKQKEHPEIKSYCLYSTMEPCPMCFGAMVMMNIRSLKYAARDGFAGATELSETFQYIKGKEMKIVKGEEELEIFQVCLQTAYECKRKCDKIKELLDCWSSYCSIGVTLGKQLYKEGYFESAAAEGKDISVIYDEVVLRLNS